MKRKRWFTVPTGEVDETPDGCPLPVVRSFDSLTDAEMFARSIGAREVTAVESIDRRNAKIVGTYYVRGGREEEAEDEEWDWYGDDVP